MNPIDWIIIAAVFIALLLVGRRTQRASHSVSDFLAANRCGRRYLLTMAEGMSTLGAISIVAYFEQYYSAGFASQWWGQMLTPVGLVIALSGWIVYRFRETRAMTMAEFFEKRYSRRFRIFAGIVAWISGVVNYGVFPGVSARLLIHLLGLPEYSLPVGAFSINVTLGVVMGFMLGVALFLTLAGGQITVMVTDFLQAQFMNIVFLAIMAFIFIRFGWSDIIVGLQNAPPEKSLINPFKQGDIPDFNVFYFLILAFMAFYGHMAWQGGQGYNCSAISPHEARMAKILGWFRAGVTGLVIMLLPITVYAIRNNPTYAALDAEIETSLQQIPDENIRSQQLTLVAMAHILPPGLIGLFAAVCLAAAISTDDTYLHSWGSIFIQDVLLPFRRRHLQQQEHLRLLRWSIVGVAIFAWCFSMVFTLKQQIFMFFQITGAIYLGGAGIAIIGGLYWKRGKAAGAWAGMITGSVLATSSVIFANELWPRYLPTWQGFWPGWVWLQEQTAARFPIDGARLGFICSGIAVVVYVVVSLFTRGPLCNMDKLLHRGRYALPGEHQQAAPVVRRFFKYLGMGREFTWGDRVIYIINIIWIMFLFVPFVLGTVWYLVLKRSFSDEAWISWWLVVVVATGVVGVVATVWFLIGGFANLRQLFSDLRSTARSSLDNGVVTEEEITGKHQ